MYSLKSKFYGVCISAVFALCNAYADGLLPPSLDRGYDTEYAAPPRYHPRPRKVYAYRDSPPPPRPRKVYVYRDAPPPPPPPRRTSYYQEPNPYMQNNFVQFKLGGFKNNGFGGNSGIDKATHSYIVGIGIGHILNDYIRATLEYDYFAIAKGSVYDKLDNNLNKTWDLSSSIITANAALSLFPNNPVDFYVKVGLGFASNKSSDYTLRSGTGTHVYPGETSANFVWRGGVGLKVSTSTDIESGIEYMFTNRGEFKTQSLQRAISDKMVTEYGSEPRKATLKDHTLSFVLMKKFS